MCVVVFTFGAELADSLWLASSLRERQEEGEVKVQVTETQHTWSSVLRPHKGDKELQISRTEQDMHTTTSAEMLMWKPQAEVKQEVSLQHKS